MSWLISRLVLVAGVLATLSACPGQWRDFPNHVRPKRPHRQRLGCRSKCSRAGTGHAGHANPGGRRHSFAGSPFCIGSAKNSLTRETRQKPTPNGTAKRRKSDSAVDAIW